MFKKLLYNLATDKYQGWVFSPPKAILFICSLIYGLSLRLAILFYRFKPYRLSCKVVSVGNITLGGTGKTSLVEFICRYLKEHGHKVAILTRGYKRKVTSQQSPVTSYQSMGDEAYMLSKKLDGVPIIVDADRIRSGNLALRKYGVDTVILDDGFQQWRVKKDLDIVTIDAVNPFGNHNLIPRGILREPLLSLKRADIFFLTKVNLNPDTQDLKGLLKKINPAALIIESMHKPAGFCPIDKPGELFDIGMLKEKSVALFCGIGDPGSFENLIKTLGIQAGLSFRFPDHHHYTQKDLDYIIKSSQDKNIGIIITTEKDAVRLTSLQLTAYSLQLLFLRIELAITKNEEGLYNRLLQLYPL